MMAFPTGAFGRSIADKYADDQCRMNEQMRRQLDAMRDGVSNYMKTPGSIGTYTSTPQNAQDPLIKPNKKLLLLGAST